MLSPTLGEETAKQLVEREASAMGLGPMIPTVAAVALLTRLEQGDGSGSLAAQLAKRRLQRSVVSDSIPPPPRPRPMTTASRAPSSAVPPSGPREYVPTELLVSLFANSLGEEKASELVARTITRLGLRGSQLTKADATNLLSSIESAGGIAAAVARFAKVRFVLAFRG